MVGDDASKLRSMLEVNYPMENGIVRYLLKKSNYNFFFKHLLSTTGIGKICVMYGTTHLVLKK